MAVICYSTIAITGHIGKPLLAMISNFSGKGIYPVQCHNMSLSTPQTDKTHT